MSPRTAAPERTRMPAHERRELVLAAASRAFSRGGYAGTSTDVIAKEAGVSQPYVVRIFGTKKELFLEVLDRACDRIGVAFQSVLDAAPFDPDADEDWGRLGAAYFELLADRDLLLVQMHGFAAGDDDEIAACSRDGMGRIFATLTSTGCTPDRAREFIAHGMLLNVMISMRAHEHAADRDELSVLTKNMFGDKLDLL